MVQDMATNGFQFVQFPKFSMQLRQVHEAMREVAIQVLLAVYLPLHDCTCDKRSQHSPNCDHHHENVESRDQ
jgi:hypothetical protein